MKKTHIADLIETKARIDGSYAIAYAIMQLAEKLPRPMSGASACREVASAIEGK